MRVLLLDATLACKDIYEALMRDYTEVYTIGNRADDYLALMNPKRHILGDYSDVSMVSRKIEELSIDFLVPGCTDVSLRTYASLSHLTKQLTNMEGISCCLDKEKLYSIFEKLKITFPRRHEEAGADEKVIVKPVDSYSGRGISVVDTRQREQLEKAKIVALQNSECGKITLNQFIDGTLVSFSVIIGPDDFTIISYVEEHCIYNRYKVDHSFCQPVNKLLENDILMSDLEKIRAYLKPSRNLFLHFQAIKKFETFYFIEMMMRHPGDLYSKLVRDSTHVDYSRLYMNTFNHSSIEHLDVVDSAEVKPIMRQTLNSNSHHKGLTVSCVSRTDLEIFPMTILGTIAKTNERIALVFHHFERPHDVREFILSAEE